MERMPQGVIPHTLGICFGADGLGNYSICNNDAGEFLWSGGLRESFYVKFSTRQIFLERRAPDINSYCAPDAEKFMWEGLRELFYLKCLRLRNF